MEATYRSSVRPPTRNPFAFTTWPVLSTCAFHAFKDATPEVSTGAVQESTERAMAPCDSERTADNSIRKACACVPESCGEPSSRLHRSDVEIRSRLEAIVVGVVVRGTLLLCPR